MKFYIAFSIHGTKKFKVAVFHKRCPIRTVANNDDEIVKATLGEEFSAVTSRRPSYDRSRDGIKVHWAGLLNKRGEPVRSASWLTRRMKELQELGWVLVEPDPCVK